MKYLNIFITLVVFTFTNISFACDNKADYANKNEISLWLGDNSLFSKAYNNGKCVLDKVLVDLPIEQRRVIANLIAKSYSIEIQNTKEVLNYNY